MATYGVSQLQAKDRKDCVGVDWRAKNTNNFYSDRFVQSFFVLLVGF